MVSDTTDKTGEAAPPPEPPAPPQDTPAEAPAAAAAPAASAESHGEETHDADTHEEAGEAHEGEAHEGEGEAHEGGATEGEAHQGGDAPKKKRRRRRKKKKDGDVAHADGTPAPEGGESHGHAPQQQQQHQQHQQQRPPKRRPDGPPRERPAFGVGDVVFGKIVEIQDECLLIDLSGKGKAIFDKLELLLPDEPAQGPGSAILDEDEEDFLPPPKESGASVVQEEADASANGATSSPPEGSEVAEAAPAEEAKEPEAPAPEAHHHHAPPPPRDPPAPVVTLPPVVLEVGANFVGVVHNDGGRGGYVVLTRHPRRGRKMKLPTAAAMREKTNVMGLVTGVIKGGIEVDIEGLRAFAPASHVELRLGGDLHHLLGQRLPFQVTQYAKRGRDIVLSRRSMIEEEAKTAREDALKRVMVGSLVEGVVRAVKDFGAFVDIGGIEGLVPLAEMSHNRSEGPHDVFSVGDSISVVVQRVDVKGKVWLSRKAALPDPWDAVTQKYAVGSRHKGKVARLQPFGAFIELEPSIDGLIHTADLSYKRIEHPKDVLKVGDEIDVVVGSNDAASHRIALYPIPEGLAEGEVPTKVAVHRIVKIAVTAVDLNGLHVRILGAGGRNARGFITSAGTGTARGTDLRKHFPVGSEHDAKVMEMDPKRNEVKLSIKAMNEDTERNAYKAYKQQVKAEAKFGTFADLLSKKK